MIMAASSYTSLNSAQLHILEMMGRCNSEASLDALKDVLCRFYAEKAQEEMDRLWDEGVVNEQIIEDWKNEHMRTPYIHAE